MQSADELEEKLAELREEMNQPDFWQDKPAAKETVAEYERLKAKKQYVGSFDDRDAVVSIIAGAGGLDAEDFTGKLLEMYASFAKKEGWSLAVVDQSMNDHDGIKSVTVDISGDGVYGKLAGESGVHRLVRKSPFNSAGKRHTSFALVEVVPEMAEMDEVELEEKDLDVSFTRSGGPGGQNVNRRETTVRITHTPSGLSARASSERTQGANREKALDILRGKLYHKKEVEKRAKQAQFTPTTSADNEWGNQMRSYVLDPYTLVKDHRNNYEESDVEAVFSGEIDGFITAYADNTQDT